MFVSSCLWWSHLTNIYLYIYIYCFQAGWNHQAVWPLSQRARLFFVPLYRIVLIYIYIVYIYIHIDTVSLVSLCKACIAQNRVVRLSCSLLEVFKPTYCKHHRIFRRYLRSVFLTHLPNNGGKKTWKRSTHHFIDGVPAAFGWWSWWARVTFSSINCLASRTSMNIARVATTHSMATRISVWNRMVQVLPEKNGKTGELGQDRLEVRWEAVMFNVVNLNVWLFLFDYLAKCFVEVVVIMFGLNEGDNCWGGQSFYV